MDRAMKLLSCFVAGKDDMSLDEELALKDQLMEKLEKSGTLASLRAQLRAFVFLALEDQNTVKNKSPMRNEKLSDFMYSKEGQQCGAIVYDFLRHLKMAATLSVFSKEIGMDVSEPKEVEYLARNKSEPILLSLLRSSPSETNNIEPVRVGTESVPKDSQPLKSPPTKKEVKATTSTGVETVSSESNENDFFDEIPAAPGTNWLSKKTTEPSSSVREDAEKGKKTGSSLLGDLPQLPGRSLPPLGNRSSSNKSNGEFMKLLTDSLENLDSGTDEDTSTAPGGSPKSNPKSFPSVPKLEKQKTVEETFALNQSAMSGKKQTSVTTDFFKKTLSTDNETSSVSEEIVEDLEVDEILDSGRSEKQISF